MQELNESQKNIIYSSIRDIPDFPKPGIIFKDITTLLNNKEAYGTLMSHLNERYKSYNLDYIAGIESRGFIFGSALAASLGLGFVPIRKPGKLPSTVVSEKYSLEYGVDEVQIHLDAFRGQDGARVLLVDDLIATGGTAVAAANLINKAGGHCVEACFVVELSFLPGRQKLESLTEVYSILTV
ncbi:MAG: adenine phosphoribosyltransferase [Campylobacteraceae bacterium]|jgi:adenine phosphoribosyltransferase|nr:adenine phosphoribosyltransferase [Campylobacteraceae bacterium]